MLIFPIEIQAGIIQPIPDVPKGAVLIECDGQFWRVYFDGDELPASMPLEPEPDWQSFRQQIAIHPAYLRIVSCDGITQAINTTLVWVLGSGQYEEVPRLWNAIAAQALPTSAEIAALNAIAEQSGVPFRLNEVGMME